ncbi:MAG: hypothetical protein IPJ65_43035 [Archangiaceae bacterium]|nr:hypothetical protein [Archangiaceae bacterium]
MTPAPSSVPLRAAQACSRCGSFSSELTLICERELCPACIERLAGATLYSAPAVRTVAVLLNPVPAAVMMALNYRRLESPRARGWLLGAVALGIGYGVLMQLPLPNFAFLAVGVSTGLAMTQRWAAVDWPVLEKAGFKRRSPWWVVLATLGAMLVLVLIYSAVAAVLDPEGLDSDGP